MNSTPEVPAVFCRASIAVVDESIPGDKPGTVMALVIAAPVDVELRVPLTRADAENTIRAMWSML